MTTAERLYVVSLYGARVGTLNQRGDYTWFRFDDDYIHDPNRVVLGLVFEDDLFAPHANSLRLPPWFSNLLPEGRLRDWIAEDRGVSVDREMELLAQVGRDLPGAVTVIEDTASPDQEPAAGLGTDRVVESESPAWKFSLAGVGLKFSMLRSNDRLSLPASGLGGDWIVKLPDQAYEDVPLNEYVMMTFARRCGIEVPEVLLVERSSIDDLPDGVWPRDESVAYAVRRFDRPTRNQLVHIEDFAQVRNVWPNGGGKYQGNFETVAALAYRGHDEASLVEAVRRLAFNVLISNGDAHLKNWSLIYEDRRKPRLSPAYDIVSTAVYADSGHVEDLGLKFGGSRSFERVTLRTFDNLEARLDVALGLRDVVRETVEQAQNQWPEIRRLLSQAPDLEAAISASIERRSTTLLSG